MNREDLQAQIDQLLRTAETGEQWAEICRIETVLNGGPWYDELVETPCF
jgi:hypothetical protein